MSVEIKIVRATMEHAAQLALRMRPADRDEVEASGGYTPLGALEDAIMMSGHTAHAAFFNGQIAGIWGVVPYGLLTGAVIPWLLTSTVIDKYPKTFLRLSLKVIKDLRKQYPFMTNMVDARYAGALRWADRLGFTVEVPERFGLHGLDFCRITMKGDDHV